MMLFSQKIYLSLQPNNFLKLKIMKSDEKFYFFAAVVGLIGLILFFVIGNYSDYEQKHFKAQEEVADTTELYNGITEDVSPQESKPIEFLWKKRESVDEMTNKTTKFAELRSMNSINQDFPYEGETYLRMTIRQKGSVDIYFNIDRGQIQCSEYSGTDCIYAKFDDEQPIRFRTVEASSGNSEIVFLSGNTKKFINKCKNAKEIKIQIPIYKYGNAVFNFYVTKPLEWP